VWRFSQNWALGNTGRRIMYSPNTKTIPLNAVLKSRKRFKALAPAFS
jgi:hypothetical protein